MVTLRLREDKSEDIPYTSFNLPIRSIIGRLSSFLGYAADWHWHPELEFIIVLEGEMTYHVNSKLFSLAQGDGMFINANQLHFGGPRKNAGGGGGIDCMFRCLQIHPSLLCADPYIEKRFVNPLLHDARYDALFFPVSMKDGASSPASPACGCPLTKDWRREASVKITALAELCMQSDDAALEIQSLFYQLWGLFFANTIAVSEPMEANILREDAALKRMISFIQEHYSEKIRLDDIARAGGVCRSKCCLLFKRALQQTVFEYLLHLRIRRSVSLLSGQKLNITEVANASGFAGTSYYGEIFKRTTGLSPSEYRQKLREKGVDFHADSLPNSQSLV